MKERRLDAQQKYLFGDITVKATEHLFDEKFSSIEDENDTKEGGDVQ